MVLHHLPAYHAVNSAKAGTREHVEDGDHPHVELHGPAQPLPDVVGQETVTPYPGMYSPCGSRIIGPTYASSRKGVIEEAAYPSTSQKPP